MKTLRIDECPRLHLILHHLEYGYGLTRWGSGYVVIIESSPRLKELLVHHKIPFTEY